MSQFRSTGGLDDAITDAGDRMFYGINRRLQLNQLQEGEVRESLNGRMEGYWKPRKAVIAQKTSLTTPGSPLRLPFYTIDSPKTISAASVASEVLSLTITGHGFAAGTTGYATIAGLSGDVTIDGVRLLSYVDANTMSCVVAGLTTISDQVGTLSATLINDNAISDVRASCLFSNPNESNKEYILVATNALVKKIEVSKLADAGDSGVTNITYPSGITLDNGVDVSMIQVFDKVMIFRDGMQALEWYPYGRPVTSASQAGTTTVTMTVPNHGLTAGTSVVIAGLTGGTPANGTFTVLSSGLTKDQFQYAFTTSQTVTFGVTSATMTDGFTLSPGGPYTQPQTFNANGSNIVATNGLVTMTITGNTTLNAGDTVTVYECTIPEFSSLVGKSFQLVTATTTQLQFYAPVPDVSSGSSSEQIEVGGRFSVGGGFMHQPGAPWGTYFQRRIWVPYYYDQGGTSLIPTFTSRKITDEIVASDILDTTTFDQIANQFRISGGTADYTVAMHGFYDDVLVVMNRNSIHAVIGTQGSLTDTVVKELTNEVGCLARKSVVMQANNMLFLSDNGVYALTFLNDYNLRGTEEPLSKNIQPYIDRINARLVSNATAVYYDNRYYLAVPLDSVAGADDALGNNAILIFNFLNKGWESLDTYGDSGFLITDFVVAGAGVKNNLYAVSSSGGIHKMEANESASDSISSEFGSSSISTEPINASLTTRGYDFGTQERKRFTDFQTQIQSFPAGSPSTFNISFSTEDPDNAFPIGSTYDLIGDLSNSDNEEETANIRGRLGGLRGYTGTIILTRTLGSPKVHSVKISGAISNRAILSQK